MSYCIFTSAGDQHNIREWLPSPSRPGDEFTPETFEHRYRIYVVYYGSLSFDVEHPLVQQWAHKGMKFPNLKWWFIMYGGSGCEYIAVWDDDTVIGETDILKLFTLAKDSGADIFQATGGSSPDYRSLQPSGYGGVRTVDFIEIGTPIFKVPFLRSFLAQYDDSLIKDWGVDVWYSHKCAANPLCRMAVTDDVHTVNPPVRANGLREVESAEGFSEWEQTWLDYSARHGLPQKPPRSAYEWPPSPPWVRFVGVLLGLLLVFGLAGILARLFNRRRGGDQVWRRKQTKQKEKGGGSSGDQRFYV